MLEKVDHIGIAVSDLDAALAFYETVFGLPCHGIETIAEQKVKVAFFPIGDTEIELLQSTSPEGPIAKFIEAKGPGIQHIAFQVADIEAAIAEMKAKGIRMIDEKPRTGAGGSKIAFLHPRSTGGILIELTQREALR